MTYLSKYDLAYDITEEEFYEWLAMPPRTTPPKDIVIKDIPEDLGEPPF